MKVLILRKKCTVTNINYKESQLYHIYIYPVTLSTIAFYTIRGRLRVRLAYGIKLKAMYISYPSFHTPRCFLCFNSSTEEIFTLLTINNYNVVETGGVIDFTLILGKAFAGLGGLFE